jgi:hypothetical protein
VSGNIGAIILPSVQYVAPRVLPESRVVCDAKALHCGQAMI